MKQNRNSIMRGMSGALGDELVFRQRFGKTVVSLPPFPRKDDPTEDQVEVRSRFKQAIRYAKIAMANPTLKAAYKAKASAGTTPQNVAFADFLKSPEILDIELINYTGIIGGTILIEAKDDFKVQSVQVSILSLAGDILESGAAVQDPENGDFWSYTNTTSNPGGEGIVKVDVRDLPGNLTSQELRLI